MIETLNLIMTHLDYFALMFIRVTALIISSPIFGRRGIPNVTKIGLCLALTFLLFSAAPPDDPVRYAGLGQYVLLCVQELLFGLIMGYVTTLFFSTVQTAGQVIDMQMGFGMVNVFDVQSNISVPVTGNLLNLMITMIFFAIDGHHKLIYILAGTFTNIPVGQVVINPALGYAALEVFILSFTLAVNVALPYILSGLLGELILGFVVRMTPQMNVFVVGMPLKVLLGLIVMLTMLPIYSSFSNILFENMYESINYMLKGLAGG